VAQSPTRDARTPNRTMHSHGRSRTRNNFGSELPAASASPVSVKLGTPPPALPSAGPPTLPSPGPDSADSGTARPARRQGHQGAAGFDCGVGLPPVPVLSAPIRSVVARRPARAMGEACSARASQTAPARDRGGAAGESCAHANRPLAARAATRARAGRQGGAGQGEAERDGAGRGGAERGGAGRGQGHPGPRPGSTPAATPSLITCPPSPRPPLQPRASAYARPPPLPSLPPPLRAAALSQPSRHILY
jgi:hypothetical protein